MPRASDRAATMVNAGFRISVRQLTTDPAKGFSQAPFGPMRSAIGLLESLLTNFVGKKFRFVPDRF